MADIFISYSSTDKTIVKHIARLLENKGWSVWWDRQIPIGQQYDTVIETELQKAGCVLVVWTKHSVTSEWVKNEASEAAVKGKLVPLLLEDVILPLAFRRTETALLQDWDGETNHPELENLFDSLSQVLAQHPVTTSPAPAVPVEEDGYLRRQWLLAGITLALTIAALLLYLLQANTFNPILKTSLLVIFGVGIAAFTSSLVHIYAFKQQLKPSPLLKMAAPFAGLLGILLGSLLMSNDPGEKNITIRLFDGNKNPITQGEVKIYLPEYVRTQSIDKMGQALFTGIPAGAFKNHMKIEVNSPGYASKVFDTLLMNTKSLELTLPFTTVVHISGKIKTAAELPIRGVELSVDGTRYYAISITDGTYNLRLEEYTLGDEISLTTSHPGFEDKTIALRIQSPNIQNQDIFLNPIAH
jgi:hypothetical protein